MKKRMIKGIGGIVATSFAVALLCAGGVTVLADGLDDFDYDVVYEDSGENYLATRIAITGYNGSSTTVTIPDNATVPVSEYINEEWKDSNKRLDVAVIGDSAFRDSNIVTVNLPNKLESLDYYSFAYCKALKNITIPSTVTEIGEGVFCGCQSLKNITLPEGIQQISDYTFSEDTSLKEIIIPRDVTRVGYSAFDGCTSLGSVTFSTTNLSIIEGAAFRDCKSLKNITLPNTVSSVGDSVFAGCTSLVEMTFPDSVVNIGAYTFEGDTSLKRVTLSADAANIQESMFRGCESLTYVNVPSDIAWIGDYSFEGCGKIEDIVYAGTIAQWKDIIISEENDILRYALITCTDGTYHEKHIRHTESSVTKQATMSADGVITYKCSKCGQKVKEETIKKIASVTLSKTEVTYNGKAQSVTVTVKDSAGKALKNGTDYTVTIPSGRINVGAYKYKVTFKGKYTGSKELTLIVTPKAPAAKKPTAGKKSLTANWGKSNGATGYEVMTATDSKFKKAKKVTVVKSGSTVKVTVKKLKKKTKYYVKVRAYSVIGGKKYYSGWTAVKNVTVK